MLDPVPRRPARRHPRGRPDPPPRRPAGDDDARAARGGRREGGAALGRRVAPRGRRRGREPPVPRGQPRQARDRARPAHAGGPGGARRAHRRRRRPRPQLLARRRRAPRRRRRGGAGAQPAPDPLLAVGLRPGAAGAAPTSPCSARAAWWRPTAAAIVPVPVHDTIAPFVMVAGHPRRALRARAQRPGPGRRDLAARGLGRARGPPAHPRRQRRADVQPLRGRLLPPLRDRRRRDRRSRATRRACTCGCSTPWAWASSPRTSASRPCPPARATPTSSPS